MTDHKRFTYTGKGPIKGDNRYGEPTGELIAGDTVEAWPVHKEHPGFLWYVRNLRNGFTMTATLHDLVAL